MVANVMIVAAVPLCTTRMTQSHGRNRFDRTDDVSNRPSRKRRRHSPVEERLRMRRLKNRESAQLSRDRVKVQREYLEKQLHELKYQKMKLLLENEYLQKQKQVLEDENISLKERVENLQCFETGENSNEEVAVKHAWFVNIPLLKEWALPKIFFFFMITVMESLKAYVSINLFYIPYLNNHNSNLAKPTITTMEIVCLSWKLLIHQGMPSQHLMIFNG